MVLRSSRLWGQIPCKGAGAEGHVDEVRSTRGEGQVWTPHLTPEAPVLCRH